MSSNSSFCCIHIPGFRTQVVEAGHPEMRLVPFVLAEQSEGILAPILAQNTMTRRLRIPEGCNLTDLRTRWPQVRVLPPQPEAEHSLQQTLCRLAEAQTPCYRWDEDALHLDLAGTQRIHGPDREAWAKRFVQSLQATTGLRSLRTAIASSRNAAIALSRAARSTSPILCPHGEERSWLARVAVNRLPGLSPTCRTRLDLYNLRTLGDLQKLDRMFLLTHFGQEGERLYALAQGADMNLQGSERSSNLPANALLQRTLFERDINLDALIQGEVHTLADRLAFHLRQRIMVAREFSLRIFYSDGKIAEGTYRAPDPTDSFATIHEGLRLTLRQVHTRRVSVRSMEVQAMRPLQGVRQMDLFQADAHKEEALATSIDKVRRKLGFEAVRNGSAIRRSTKAKTATKSTLLST